MFVFDASTLILLARVDLLRVLLGRISAVIPESVQKEATLKNTLDARAIAQLITEKKLKVSKDPSVRKMRQILQDFPVGHGEVAAFLIAKEKGAILATDDGVAIKICKIFGVKFVTAIHFLIEMRIRRDLDESLALAKLELLEKYGRYASEILRDAVERIHGGK